MAGLRIHLRHVRAVDSTAGPLCTPGIRTWCRRHDIDLHALATVGIDSDTRQDLHADPFVARVLRIVREEYDHSEQASRDAS